MYNKYNIQYDRKYLLTAPFREVRSLSHIDIFFMSVPSKIAFPISPDVELAHVVAADFVFLSWNTLSLPNAGQQTSCISKTRSHKKAHVTRSPRLSHLG